MPDTACSQFSQYGLSGEIMEALALYSYTEPTKIQEEVIPLILSGKQLIVKSQTGTGKTAAFGIPVCNGIDWEENLPQALILEPARELAAQAADELFHIGRMKRLKVPALFGGLPIDKQIQTLRQKCHIVTGTPGRIMDHIRRGSLNLSNIKYVVIDEADLMLDMGFLDEVERILSFVPAAAQKLLFSATMDGKIQKLADEYMKDAIWLSKDEEPALQIKHVIYKTSPDNKYRAFICAVTAENPESAMIFCGTREMVNVLYQKLKRDKIYAAMLHGDMDQRERLKTIDRFRMGQCRFLIATDVAARGIDFETITHVFHYDFPTGRETYIHRSGRTGRNGKSGTAISLVCQEDERMLAAVEEYIGRLLPEAQLREPDLKQKEAFMKRQREISAAREKKGAAFNKTIARLIIGGGRKSKMRAVDIVGAISNIEGVEALDIGIIDVRESVTYVEILNEKGAFVLEALKNKPIKGKLRKVRLK